jgi:hypothetical protein
MKRWLWLALAGLGVWLLLAFVHSEAERGVDSHWCVARGSRSVGPRGEPALASPTAALAKNCGPGQARAAVPESLAVDLALLTERGVDPPWLDSRGPPGSTPGAWVERRANGQTGSPEQGVCASSPRGPDQAPTPRSREGGFATGFS